MEHNQQFYIHGQWVNPIQPLDFDVINPATEQVCATISLGSALDVDAAVQSAREAFVTYSQYSIEQRIELFDKIIAEYKVRFSDLVEAVSTEMGAPKSLSANAQVPVGLGHFKMARDLLKTYPFAEVQGKTTILQEPIGVCALITPWNWPLNQIACKVAPALATGCTVVLKPSEIAPLSGIIFAEILDKAGVPAGVFNLVNGDGPTVGGAMSSHPLVDMVSFTGSTRAGAAVAQNAAPSIKRVSQELGGKSANILLDDVDLETAVKRGVRSIFSNTGQSCNAPTRMLVHESQIEQVEAIAKLVAEQVVIGDPQQETTTMGPLVSEVQFNKVQALIQAGIDEGAFLVCGGVGKPQGMDKGYFVKPTIFSRSNNQMTIAKEEIFGPVLTIIPYKTDEEAIHIANDSPYGLAGYIQGNDPKRLQAMASKIRAGCIYINGQSGDLNTPFGGYKHSGNGREWGEHGFKDYLEVKAVMGLA